AVAAVAALDVSTLDRTRYFQFVATVQRQLDQLHVAHARSLRFGEVTHRYVGTGSRSMADWLSSHTGSSYGDTRGKVRLADVLRRSAELSGAVDSGEVSPATAQVLHDAVLLPPEGADVGGLVERVRGIDPRAARVEVDRWRAEHAVETDEEAEDRRHRARSLTFGAPADGMITGSFVLPLLAARQVQASVASLAGKPSDTDCRSTAQRYADGLVLLADAYAKGDITGGRERATLVVNVPVDSLVDGANTPATTVFGDLLPAFVARRLAGDAAVRKIVTDGLEVLALGRPHRLASTAQWLALVARDGGCRWPGCTIPATWCDVDHFVPWEHGGDTNLDNLWLLCRHHHTERHRPGVTLTGTVLDAQLTLADGTPIHCVATPPGPQRTRQRRTTAAA
ncbi:MAG: DUF222 domain-containing protein, partial [Ilumatobacteraceae bacterium]